MAPTPSIKIVHESPYEGGTKQWSNRHHFSGGTPPDLAHWTTLVNAIVAAEKPTMGGEVAYKEAVCYEAGSDLPLHTITLTGSGTISGNEATAGYMPLEVCALVRYSTTQRTSKNHPVYLFSYFHNVFNRGVGANEELSPNQRGKLNTYAAAWVSGFSDGVTTYHRAGPNGAVAQDGACETYMTHRDFPT